MGSGFLDLTRDFGGAVLQAIMGGLLAAAYATHITRDLDALPSDEAAQVGTSTAEAMTQSFSSAAQAAQQYPTAVQDQIIAAAATAFTAGKSWAILIALLLTLAGLLLVWLLFPRRAEEEAYYEQVLESASVPTPPST
jgi:hypothetical protein